MKYKLIIFDFDGTLANSFPWFVSVFNDVARSFRFRQIQSSELELVRRMDTGELLKFLGVPRWKLPFIAYHVKSMMRKDLAAIKLFRGTPEMLQSLHSKGIKLAIVSSNSASNIKSILGPESSRLIDHFVTEVSLFGKGPKLKKLLRTAKISPQEAIYVGDEVRDILAARASGMESGAVAWGYSDIGALSSHGPSQCFHEFSDILQLL